MSVPVLRQSIRPALSKPYKILSSRCGNTNILLRAPQSRLHSTEQPSSSLTPPPSSSSVSQDEVSHFTKLASSWWDPHGPSRLLHLMNPLRHDFITSCLQTDPNYDPSQKRSYLDIGCGGGIFATSAARLPHTSSVTAIDPTPSVIQVARAKQRSDPALSPPKLTYLNCAIEDLTNNTTSKSPQSQSQSQTSQPNPQQYDIITVFEVLEHITHPSTFLHKALKHLKPNGFLIGSTIARHPLSYITTKLIAEAPLIGVVPAGTHDWNQYINPSELEAWFTKENTISSLSRSSDPSATMTDNSNNMGGRGGNQWGDFKVQGVIYIPALGWKFVNGSQNFGNYFFGVQKLG